MNSAIVQKILAAGETGILQQRLAYVAGTAKIEYIGKALPGVAEGDSSWQLCKLTYDGNNVTEINFASNNSNFDFSWTDRADFF